MKQTLIDRTARLLKEQYKKYDDIDIYYQDTIISELDDNASDLDLVVIAKDIILMAADRLNADLNDTAIKEEYDKLKGIANELEIIIKNYV